MNLGVPNRALVCLMGGRILRGGDAQLEEHSLVEITPVLIRKEVPVARET